jgi:hypothetical protein
LSMMLILLVVVLLRWMLIFVSGAKLHETPWARPVHHPAMPLTIHRVLLCRCVRTRGTRGRGRGVEVEEAALATHWRARSCRVSPSLLVEMMLLSVACAVVPVWPIGHELLFSMDVASSPHTGVDSQPGRRAEFAEAAALDRSRVLHQGMRQKSSWAPSKPEQPCTGCLQ